MSPGDVVLLPMLKIGGAPPKLRPALVLADLPGPYQTLLLCGISTQLHTILPNWDEAIRPADPDFPVSGLLKASVIRLSYLAAAAPAEVVDVIGRIAPDRVDRLRTRLADRVRP